MNTEKLTALITILVILSLATERLVEIVKGIAVRYKPDFLKPPFVNEIGEVDPNEETVFKAKNHFLAVICGIVTALLSSPLLADIFSKLFPADKSCKLFGLFEIGNNSGCGFDLTPNGILLIFTLGFLASAGSGFWNTILEYILKIKDLKKIEVGKNAALARVEVLTAQKNALDNGVELKVNDK